MNDFICANTKNGFYSLQNEIINTNAKRVYIIKGGPGSGKSTFIKKVTKALGYTELLHCSSDPDSLDGAVLSDSTVLFDGTSPHLAEPPIPGAAGRIINTADFWDERKLSSSKDEINSLNEKIKNEYNAAYSLLKAAGETDELISNNGFKKLNLQKIKNYAENFVKRNLPLINTEGFVSKRFLDSLCFKGFFSLSDSVKEKALETIFLDDPYFISSDIIMNLISEFAVKRGYKTTVFYSPLNPNRISHLFIHGVKIFFTTNKKIADRNIKCQRFYNNTNENAARIKFYELLHKSSLEAAYERLRTAKTLHDELESYYINALNKNAFNAFTEKFINSLR